LGDLFRVSDDWVRRFFCFGSCARFCAEVEKANCIFKLEDVVRLPEWQIVAKALTEVFHLAAVTCPFSIDHVVDQTPLAGVPTPSYVSFQVDRGLSH